MQTDYQQQSGESGLMFMTFGQKVSTALSLSKRKGVSIFLVSLLGYLALTILSFGLMAVFGFSPFAVAALADGTSETVAAMGMLSALLGIFAVSIFIFFLFQFFAIGLNSLVLCYIDNDEPSSILNIVFSPWRRFGALVISVLVWLVVYVGAAIIFALIGLIPILGWLVDIAGSIILSMAFACAMFYMADKGKLNPIDSVTQPLRMVTGNFMSWLGVSLFIFLISIPALILIAIGASFAQASSGAMLLFILLTILYLVGVTIFAIFLMGITYRQSRAMLPS